MSDQKPHVSADNEAVDLLMLFSTQAKTKIQPHNEPTTSNTNSTTDIYTNQELKIGDSTETKQLDNNSIKSPTLSTPSTSTNISSNNTSFQMQRRKSSISRDNNSNNSNTSNIRLDKVTRSPGPAAAALATGNSGNSSNKAI
ncbi:hypothetical protein C6P40_000964, partial [Pichia californica]